MLTTQFKQQRYVSSFGIMISIDRSGFYVSSNIYRDPKLLTVEIYCGGRLMISEVFRSDNAWHNYYQDLDPLKCGVRVLDLTGSVIAVLDVEEDPYPFMKPQGEQKHITESYVSVPPALTITDEMGAIWTLGMEIAAKHKSPDGEFAFPVLRNGEDMHEYASRIERRNGKTKIFTSKGWKVWTGQSFF